MTASNLPEYEYDTLVHTTELKPGLADVSCDEISDAIANAFGRGVELVSKHLPKLGEGGWQLVSHSATRLDRWLVTTFLLRRPYRRNDQSF